MTASIFVTQAVNDRDLLRALGPIATCVPIPHGDCCWFGCWEDESGQETTIRVLVERKKIGDLVNSILGGRYLHQAQEAHEAGFDRLILIVEGPMRPGPVTGLVEVPRTRPVVTPGRLLPHFRRRWEAVQPGIAYSRWDQYLTELDVLAGITVKRSENVRETAAIVKALWLSFQTPPSKHQSLKQIWSPPPPQISLLSRPSLVRRVAKELPDIGWERSKAVEARFPSVREMMCAGVLDWESLPGIGRKTAEKVVMAIHGGGGA